MMHARAQHSAQHVVWVIVFVEMMNPEPLSGAGWVPGPVPCSLAPGLTIQVVNIKLPEQGS